MKLLIALLMTFVLAFGITVNAAGKKDESKPAKAVLHCFSASQKMLEEVLVPATGGKPTVGILFSQKTTRQTYLWIEERPLGLPL